MMQPLIVLLVIYLVAVLVVLPIWVIVKVLRHDGDLELLQSRLRVPGGRDTGRCT